ncbi:MAG: hypothetical protein AAFO69_13405, partial [Bacteroidota bacterium]
RMKKVLLISYYWPPAGGVSVLRTLKIAKYLREFGWEPVVFTTSNASFPYIDKGNLKDVPDGITVIKRPILEPFEVFKKLTGRKKEERLDNILQVRSENTNLVESLGIWVRANFFIPDARSLWIGPSVRYLKQYLKDHPVDAIFSDGPPHTNTVIANKISQHFKLPWLADFQDPWTQADYYEMFPIGALAHRIHQKQESRVFEEANKITIASPSWAKDLEAIGAKNVDVIYYGYDEADFSSPPPPRYGKITITHAGLLGIDRFPRQFFEALKGLMVENPDLPDRLEVKLVGQVDWSIKEDIENLGLQAVCTFQDFIPRQEVIKMNRSVHLLLLPLNIAKNTKGRLPGKLYEYLRSNTPVLAFGPPDSDAAKILDATGCGVTINYEDQNEAKRLLTQLLQTKTLADYQPSQQSIAVFSNQQQTKKVAMYLDQITENRK